MMQSVKAVFLHADDQDKLVSNHTVDDTEI